MELARGVHGAQRRCGGVALTPPIEPMLAEARRELPPDGSLPGGLVMEAKSDGFRALLFARPDGVLVQSRQGADLTSAFPDIAAAAAGLDLVLDGELVVPAHGRLDFGELQRRARRRGRSAVQAAVEFPAYLIVFDILEADGVELLARPYRHRRAVLEERFARGDLTAPFTLCPHTTDRAVGQEWLDPAWGAAGVEGVVVKGLNQPYLPGKRAWVKVRSYVSSEAVLAGITGSFALPRTMLLGRYDTAGGLRLIARTTPLRTAERRAIAQRVSPGGPDHPWHGRRFTASWGARGGLEFHPVRPELVVEFVADTAVDAGRYRHPVRYHRLRDDLAPDQVPPFES
ncbi:ATP-dependent DNA ligase [Streptomyces sp. NPDC053367]|uniref:ATP-dependent DNA ligase n=1 Tax=Streptomyces sp. NPDC053367 TaxID=3365700 RepID=UPI0037D876B8